MCAFRDHLEQFAQLDTVVIGISTDTLKLQEEFTQEQKLTYPLVGDTDKSASKAFGVLQPSGFAKRSTFVIDKKGTIRKMYDVKNIDKHPEEVAAFIKENLK